MDIQTYLEKAFEEIRDTLASTREATSAEIAKLRQMIEETRSIAEAAGRQEQVQEELAKLAAQVEQLRAGRPGDPDPAVPEWQTRDFWRSYQMTSIEAAKRVRMSLDDLGFQRRDTATTSDFPRTPRPGQPVMLSQYPVSLLDLIQRIQTSAQAVDVIRETKNEALGYAHYTAAADYLATDTTITLDSVDGLLVGSTIRISNGTAVVEKTISAINTSTKVVTLTAAIGIAGSAGDDVWSTLFGVIAEGGTAPYSSLGTTKVTKAMKKIPVLMSVTEELLKDGAVPQWIRSKLRDRVRRSVEWHLLYGDGSSDELDGLATDADVQTHLWSTDPAGSNRIDCVLFAGTEIRSAGPVVLVLNRADWAKIRTLKDTSGAYLLKTRNFGTVDIGVQPGNLYLDQYPVVLSEAVVPGDFFLVDTSRASTIYERDSGAFAMGYVNDDFARMKQAARYVVELVHGIQDPFAYVHGYWDAAP